MRTHIITKKLTFVRIVISAYGFYSPLSDGTIKKWTHQGLIDLLEVNSSITNKRNLTGGIVGINKSFPKAISLVSKWEDYCKKENFIAPKGSEEQGTVQFKIEADVFLPEDFTVRAGYSANASLVLQKKDSVQAIREALLQFDSKTQEPYVEIETTEQQFERRELTLGISDGINVEIVSGIEKEDIIKVWNNTEEPDKLDSDENEK